MGNGEDSAGSYYWGGSFDIETSNEVSTIYDALTSHFARTLQRYSTLRRTTQSSVRIDGKSLRTAEAVQRLQASWTDAAEVDLAVMRPGPLHRRCRSLAVEAVMKAPEQTERTDAAARGWCSGCCCSWIVSGTYSIRLWARVSFGQVVWETLLLEEWSTVAGEGMKREEKKERRQGGMSD